MWNSASIGASAVIAFASGSTSGSAQATDPSFAALDAQVQRLCDSGEFSGVIQVVRDRQVAMQRACGMADPVNAVPNTMATRFKIYSMSKLITALTVMRLVELGQIDLDRPITAYISNLPSEWSGVTVRHLLNHTSGLPDLTEAMLYRFRTDQPAALDDLLAHLTDEQRRPSAPVGVSWRYNNFGYELLARAASNAAGRPFADVVKQHVFDPADMQTASIEAPNIVAGHASPVSEDGLAIGYNGTPGKLEYAHNFAFVQLGAGAVRASAADFQSLDKAISEGRVVKASTWRLMTASPYLSKDGRAVVSPTGYGLGVVVAEIRGVRMEGHTGGTNGYVSEFERFPDQNASMVILTNRGFTPLGAIRREVVTALTVGRLNPRPSR